MALKGAVIDPTGAPFGVIWDHNEEADEVVINIPPKDGRPAKYVTISQHSLVPTDVHTIFQLVYDIELPDEPEATGQKFDDGKLDWTLLPTEAIEDVIRVLEFGAKKYGRENWRQVEGGHRRYLAAAYRHVAAIQKGEDLDSESGLPHAAHAVCCLLFLGYFDGSDH